MSSCLNQQDLKLAAIKNGSSLELIDTIAEQYLMTYIENTIKYGTNDSSSTFIFVCTHRDIFNNTVTNDSILYISTLNCDDSIFSSGYIGIIRLSGFTIAIFDDTTFGSMLYDSKQVIDTSLNSLDCQEKNMRGLNSFKFYHNQILRWR